MPHWTAAKRVLKYLKKTKAHGLFFGSDDKSEDIKAGVDADWGGCVDTGRSTTGFACKLGDAMLCWKSRRQGCVALSSAEAEYVGLGECVREVTWIRSIGEFLRVDIQEPTLVLCDNQSAIKMSQNLTDIQGKTKHIALKHHYTREQVAGGIIYISYVRTDMNAIDIMTKALGNNKFDKFKAMIQVKTLPLNPRKSDESCNIADSLTLLTPSRMPPRNPSRG